AKEVFRLRLEGDTQFVTAPGQFVNIQLEGNFLRRPISVCDWDDHSFTLIYKVVGIGTAQLSRMQPGESLNLLTGLGNGFSLELCGATPLLVGGGVGVPPLYGLAKRLAAVGRPPVVVLGFRTVDDLFYQQEFEALGCRTIVATEDGSAGIQGFVTDAIRQAAPDYDSYCCCGPEAMLHAVYDLCGLNGQLSFERRMGCGFGACMGCSCETKYGARRICKDGPVLKGEEIIW
ncbi:MAG: dihydroorotate dehydrogenase electron transfer subunit, partial [Angelakisella sp.]